MMMDMATMSMIHSTATTRKRPRITLMTLMTLTTLMRLMQGTTKHMQGSIKHIMTLMVMSDMQTDMAQ